MRIKQTLTTAVALLMLVAAAPAFAVHKDVESVRIWHQHDGEQHELQQENIELAYGETFEFVVRGFSRRGEQVSAFDWQPVARVAIGRDELSDDNSFGELVRLGTNKFAFRAKERPVQGLRVLIFDPRDERLKADFTLSIKGGSTVDSVTRLEVFWEDRGRITALSESTLNVPSGGQVFVIVRGYDKNGREVDNSVFDTKLQMRGGKTFGKISRVGRNRFVVTAGPAAETHIRTMAFVPETEVNTSFFIDVAGGAAPPPARPADPPPGRKKR